MVKSDGVKKAKKNIAGVAPAVAVIAPLIPLVEPVVDLLIKKLSADNQKDLLEIPILYCKDIAIKLERATFRLEELGFKVESTPVKEANIKYKDCVEFQIVGTTPKQKKKVQKGKLVYLRYVTLDIIEKSQLLFEKTEEHKAEVKSVKADKRNEQKQKVQKLVTSSLNKFSKKHPEPIRDRKDASADKLLQEGENV